MTTLPAVNVRCVGYCRVSTERQAGEVHTSLSDQAEAIEQLAGRLEVPVERWYRDEGASGATVAGRPAFRQLINDCMASPRPRSSPGFVLALNDSRFGRFPDPDEAAALRFQLRQAGWHVRFAEGDDIQDETFRPVIRALGSAQASEYRRVLQKNTRRGMRGAAGQGFWTRKAPYGYRRQVVYPPGAERVLDRGQQKVPGEKVKLTPHAEEAAIVRWIFEAYAGGTHSLASLASAMLEREPGRRWGRTVLQHVLRNEAYLGHIRGGTRGTDPAGGAYGCENAHPAIVDELLFGRVQRRLEENRTQAGPQTTVYLLTGILMCPHCGEAYTGGGGGRSRNQNPARSHRRFYRDRGGVLKVCPGRIGTIMRHLVDDAVVRTLGRTLRSARVVSQIERAVDVELESAKDDAGHRVAAARRRVRELGRRRDRLVDAIAKGLLLEHEAGPQIENIRREIESLEARLHVTRFGQRSLRAAAAERNEILELARNFDTIIESARGRARRELMRMWLAGATFDKMTRQLELQIRRIPALPSLALSNAAGPG